VAKAQEVPKLQPNTKHEFLPYHHPSQNLVAG